MWTSTSAPRRCRNVSATSTCGSAPPPQSCPWRVGETELEPAFEGILRSGKRRSSVHLISRSLARACEIDVVLACVAEWARMKCQGRVREIDFGAARSLQCVSAVRAP